MGTFSEGLGKEKMIRQTFKTARDRIPGVSLLVASLFAAAACSAPGAGTEDLAEAAVTPADLIISGDNILTMDGSDIEAVAVTGDTISATGTKADILRYRGDGTRLIELGDHALLPGFLDAHSHITMVANTMSLANLSSPPVGTVETIADLQAQLKAKIEADQIPPGEWVVGYGYDDSLLAEGRHPTRQDLDAVSTEHPIAIMHVSGHLAVANTAALELTGITAEAQDPPGGHIRREEGSAQPSGVLEESAARPVLYKAYMPDPETVPAQVRAAMELYASEGFTTVQDGGSSLPIVNLLKAEAAKTPYPLDMVMFPTVNQVKACTADTYHDEAYTGGVRIGGVKFILDGSPQGRTAYLTEPYTLPPEGKGEDYVAYPSMLPGEVNPKVEDCLSHGVPMMLHANGDAAIDMVIDAVGEALEETPDVDHRTVIIHAQLIREDQLDDVKTLGLVPSYYSAHPYFWGDWHAVIFGEARASRISPVRSTIERGIPFTIHNDAPVIPPMAMRLVDITVNRTTRSGRTLGEAQRATPYEALYAMTMGGAYQYFEEDVKGSITTGKLADLVILEANPLEVPTDTLADVDVIETISHGKTVYTR